MLLCSFQDYVPPPPDANRQDLRMTKDEWTIQGIDIASSVDLDLDITGAEDTLYKAKMCFERNDDGKMIRRVDAMIMAARVRRIQEGKERMELSSKAVTEFLQLGMVDEAISLLERTSDNPYLERAIKMLKCLRK
mmetsp:Transcript_6738/g.8491  ORF Transcript_6738/g.8491 Transcript_6738/m.8491 type:complete len:135 (+) Transcript_6738:153-557(+)